jgi:hypothetical protein
MSLYLYLARRDKTGVKVLSIFQSNKVYPATRVTDVESLGLPAGLQESISSAVHNDRMLWEPWVESADNYEELKKSLRERGYSGVPQYSMPKHMPVPGLPGQTPALKKTPPARGTMLRKGTRPA